MIEDTAGRTLAIAGGATPDIFASDEEAWEESDDDADPVADCVLGSVDFAQSWRS